MSPILFNLVVETMADKLQKDETIGGVKVASIQYKLALYVDDIVFFLSNPFKSFKELKLLLAQFVEDVRI